LTETKCEFDDGNRYEDHEAEYAVSEIIDGKIIRPMLYCRAHFYDYALTTKLESIKA
jgi:hypothetical protein